MYLEVSNSYLHLRFTSVYIDLTGQPFCVYVLLWAFIFKEIEALMYKCFGCFIRAKIKTKYAGFFKNGIAQCDTNLIFANQKIQYFPRITSLHIFIIYCVMLNLPYVIYLSRLR